MLLLNDEDVRQLRDLEPDSQKRTKKQKEREKKKGEGYIELSWIWKTVGVSGDKGNESLQEGENLNIFLIIRGLTMSSTTN